jgi:hypothetical protein
VRLPWAQPTRYCSQCGRVLVPASRANGFDEDTGAPRIKTWWRCPRSDGYGPMYVGSDTESCDPAVRPAPVMVQWGPDVTPEAIDATAEQIRDLFRIDVARLRRALFVNAPDIRYAIDEGKYLEAAGLIANAYDDQRELAR